MIIRTVGPEYVVSPCRPTDWKFKSRWNGCNRFCNSQEEAVGLLMENGWGTISGRVSRQQDRVEGKKVFKGRFLFLRPSSSSLHASASERTNGEVLYLESQAVGLLGLRKFILSHQPLDCWGFAFPGYRQWVCRNSVVISRREEGAM